MGDCCGGCGCPRMRQTWGKRPLCEDCQRPLPPGATARCPKCLLAELEQARNPLNPGQVSETVDGI